MLKFATFEMFIFTPQKNAKKLAEKRFSETLKNAGFDDDFVNSYASSSRAHNAGDGDYASDSFENSPLKSDENASDSEEEYEKQLV